MTSSERGSPSTLAELTQATHRRSLGVAGDTVAMTDGTMSLTWDEFEHEVARLAAALRGLGVVNGDRVAVRMVKSVWSFVAMHAGLRAGAIVVPVDPAAPPAAVVRVLTDSGASVLLASSKARQLDEMVSGTDVGTVVFPAPGDVMRDDLGDVTQIDRAAIEAQDTNGVDEVVIEPDDPAFIIYTSGSTGTPKGIVHTHAGALAHAQAVVDAYDIGPDDRTANVAPLHFDLSTVALYSAPLAGASVLVVPDPVLRFPASVTKMIADHGVTVWYSVPFLLVQMTERGALGDHDLSALRWILYAGEAFVPSRLATLMQLVPHARVSNIYGPSETNQCTIFDLDAAPSGDDQIPIGGAWSASELAVVDPDDLETPTPEGDVGMLLVATTTMMRGYWQRPDLDDAAFVKRPNTISADDRWYITGDLVQARADGELVFIGRADNQVKVRGHRLELEALDAAVLDLDEIDDGAVVIDRADDGADEIVALVVAKPDGPDPDVTEIRRQLANRLPPYAVPSRVIQVSTLTRTATGKIDRGAAARQFMRIED